MTQYHIENLLRNKIGLDVNSISSGLIKRAITERMRDCEIVNVQSYLHRLHESKQEWEALIELVTVPETWFFRERESFDFLKHYVTSKWLSTPYPRVLRVLSIPCSTGEEPYSIAIALLEAGLSATRIRIDAVDISKGNLLTAKLGIYRNYSFRGNPISFQESYFHKTEFGYQICEQVKSMVNFMYGNLADSNFTIGEIPYDIIFCRNLLIYFDRAIKKRTIGVLEGLLRQGGLLFLGYAETGLLLDTSFQLIRHSHGFAYSKPERKSRDLVNKTQKYSQINSNKTITDKTKAAPKQIERYYQNQGATASKNYEKLSPNFSDNLLETVKALENQGDLNEAARLCNNYIQQNPLNIEAYILQSELYQGMGNNQQAIQCLKKAIYLQPNSVEALTHLALLYQNQGDRENANLLWQRIQRI